jgi:hypothetical protein
MAENHDRLSTNDDLKELNTSQTLFNLVAEEAQMEMIKEGWEKGNIGDVSKKSKGIKNFR